MRPRSPSTVRALTLATLLISALPLVPSTATGQWPRTGQDADGRRTFAIKARKYQFDPARLEVRHNEIVRIELTTDDIPHSFTLDAYRIAKRATPGKTTTFEFRAEEAGTFTFYCSLHDDEGCRDMKGELVVRE